MFMSRGARFQADADILVVVDHSLEQVVVPDHSTHGDGRVDGAAWLYGLGEWRGESKGIGLRVSAAGVQVVVIVDLKVGNPCVVSRIAAAASGVDLQEHPMMGIGVVVVDQYVLRLKLLSLATLDVLVDMQETVVIDGKIGTAIEPDRRSGCEAVRVVLLAIV